MSSPAILQSDETNFVPLSAQPDAINLAEPGYRIIRRNGAVTPFNSRKISVALTKAFLAVEGSAAAGSRRVHEAVEELTGQVVSALMRRAGEGRLFHIEDVQDQVELALMRGGHHKVARAYVLYREERARERGQAATAADLVKPTVHMTAEDGSRRPLEETRLAAIIEEACNGLDAVSPEPILSETRRNLYDGITQVELSLAPIMAARTLIEQEPNYAFVAARLLLDRLRSEALTLVSGRSEQATQAEMSKRYASYFPEYILTGVEAGQIDPELSRFDLKRIAAALKPERDLNFQYLGLQTLYDRYLLH